MSLPGDRMSASRRKSLNLLTHFADGEDKPSPTLFNLGDLILTSLRSKSQQTVAATLKLVSVMIQRHHQYVISTLLRTSPAVQSRPQRTIGAHNKEMELLFSLIDDLGEDDNLDKSYDNHIKTILACWNATHARRNCWQIKTRVVLPIHHQQHQYPGTVQTT
jgi:hypothetical protein